MSKHTPGPWMMAASPSSVVGWPVVKCGEGGGRSICSLSYLPGNDEVMAESAANGRLIEAAPDLLSIVKRFIALPSGAWHPERHAAEEAELMTEARALIGKIEP